MDREPMLRKKHQASDARRDKGPIFASQKHVRMQLDNQWRHEKNLKKPKKESTVQKELEREWPHSILKHHSTKSVCHSDSRRL